MVTNQYWLHLAKLKKKKERKAKRAKMKTSSVRFIIACNTESFFIKKCWDMGK